VLKVLYRNSGQIQNVGGRSRQSLRRVEGTNKPATLERLREMMRRGDMAGAEREPRKLLTQTDEAIRQNDQARACALIARYGELGGAPEAVFETMLKYAVSEDGALHAEKYFQTITEGFATTRPSMRWRHLVVLARMTASEHGHPAPGHDQSRRLLGVG